MNKEAQICDHAGLHQVIDNKITCNKCGVTLRVYELPKDKPPLLSDDNIAEYLDDTRGQPCSDFQDGFFCGANYARQCQRHLDIKWYEG